MELWPDTSIPLFIILFITTTLTFLFKSRSTSGRPRPPGPPGWPVIGNIFDIGLMPHRNMYNLKSRYGPILWLRIGTQNMVVVQSAAAAAELFKRHDLRFSDRRVTDSMTACGYDKGSLAFARYGDYWRIVRRLCSMELTVQRINGSATLREKCVDNMVRWIKEDTLESKSGEIQLDKYLSLMTFNLVSSFLLSRDIMDRKSSAGNNFFEAMNGFMEWHGRPNLVDAFKFLKRIDPQGIRSKTRKYLGRLLDIIGVFVKERIREMKQGIRNETRDLLDALLEYSGEGSENLSEKSVTIIILEMFFAGTETTSSTIQWTMAELLKNPNTLTELKTELHRVVGNSRAVNEKDLSDLPYLQAVVKEAMRLHPALPLLMPRNATEATEFMGYFIPEDTIVLLNAWAIHRDPDSWQDPFSFTPERFLNLRIDHKGRHFELIPFGSGRRSCTGMLLGERMVSLSVARLVQAFDWELPAGGLDMREMMGISLRKLIPLKAIAKTSGGTVKGPQDHN